MAPFLGSIVVLKPSIRQHPTLELFKKTLPSASLLQLKATSATSRRKVLTIIRQMRTLSQDAARPDLDFLSMAISSRGVDFSKVTTASNDDLRVVLQ